MTWAAMTNEMTLSGERAVPSNLPLIERKEGSEESAEEKRQATFFEHSLVFPLSRQDAKTVPKQAGKWIPPLKTLILFGCRFLRAGTDWDDWEPLGRPERVTGKTWNSGQKIELKCRRQSRVFPSPLLKALPGLCAFPCLPVRACV